MTRAERAERALVLLEQLEEVLGTAAHWVDYDASPETIECWGCHVTVKRHDFVFEPFPHGANCPVSEAFKLLAEEDSDAAEEDKSPSRGPEGEGL